jgi:hypothetical protein
METRGKVDCVFQVASHEMVCASCHDWREIVTPHNSVALTLGPGQYKVAGELSDKSVIPFFGLRNYSGVETERFWIDRDLPAHH